MVIRYLNRFMNHNSGMHMNTVFLQRTALFVANEYLRAHGGPGLVDQGKVGEASADVAWLTDPVVEVAKGTLDVEGLDEGHKRHD